MHHNRFMALFRDHPGEMVPEENFIVQEKINRGRHTDHPARSHSIRTNQCPPPPSPHFLQAVCPSCHPTNSVKALKATNICYAEQHKQLECGPMPNVMVALPNIGGALCSTPQFG